SLSFVPNLLRQHRANGEIEAKRRGGYQKPTITNEHLSLIQSLVEEKNDLLLRELCDRYAERTGIRVSITTMHRVLLVLVVYAFYYLCRQTPISVWLLIILLTGVSTLPLMVPDLIFGGMRSVIARYMIPSLLGVELAIAYLLGRNLANPSLKFWHQKFWQLLLVILFSGSILSCAINAQATVWYNKGHNGENIAVGKIVNQTTHPLLIS
ncbi:MAG: hypothetical protein ACYT04_63980, partial [Nostoc sp.]